MSLPTSASDVDVVVIGAGNAGLTAAVRLAQSDATTVLLEQHNIPRWVCHVVPPGAVPSSRSRCTS